MKVLANYITVMGDDGKINLNTAPSVVLQALAPEMTRKLAQELIEFREDHRYVKLLSNSDWYRQVSGFPSGINFNDDLLTVTGKYFMVRVNANHSTSIAVPGPEFSSVTMSNGSLSCSGSWSECRKSITANKCEIHGRKITGHRHK